MALAGSLAALTKGRADQCKVTFLVLHLHGGGGAGWSMRTTALVTLGAG